MRVDGPALAQDRDLPSSASRTATARIGTISRRHTFSSGPARARASCVGSTLLPAGKAASRSSKVGLMLLVTDFHDVP